MEGSWTKGSRTHRLLALKGKGLLEPAVPSLAL